MLARIPWRRALLGVMALLALVTAGCAQELPRAWREALYGPDPTPTPRLLSPPTATATTPIGTPTPLPTPTRLPTLTPMPTRTSTATHTATPTPSRERLVLQQGALWYRKDRFVAYDGFEDTYVSAWNRTANFADAPVLSVRQGGIMAALLYVNLGDLPATLPVLRAELELFVGARSNETPMTLTVRAILKPWLLREATWLQAKNGLPWQAPGGEGESDREDAPALQTVVNRTGVWLSFDITGWVRQWLRNPEINQGVIITGDAPNAVQYDITAADSADARHRPRLILTLPTGALALGPPHVPTPTPTLTPTVNPFWAESVGVLRLLPLCSTLVTRASGQLDERGSQSIVAAYRMAGADGARIAVFTYSPAAADYRLWWNSQELTGTQPIQLDLVDVTADNMPEILVSAVHPVTGGRMLYVFIRRPGDYRLAAPSGGPFDGKGYYGDAGFELTDVNGDGRVEIRAFAAGGPVVYAWDGVTFAMQTR